MSKKSILRDLVMKDKKTEKQDVRRIDIFKKISGGYDEKTVEEVCEYLDNVLQDGKQYVVPRGNISDILESHPGIAYYFRGIYNDVQQVRRLLETWATQKLNEKHKYYMYSEDARAEYGAVKTTDAGKLAASDEEVVQLQNHVRKMAYYEHHMENLVKSLDDLKYVIHDIITVAKEKIGDTWIDPTS